MFPEVYSSKKKPYLDKLWTSTQRNPTSVLQKTNYNFATRQKKTYKTFFQGRTHGDKIKSKLAQKWG